MKEEDFIKLMIRNTEGRYIWYKTEIESLHKNKEIWPPADEFTIWYKEFLRAQKNSEESHLKELQIEMTHCKHGMNPPFCYSVYKKNKGVTYIGMYTKKSSPVTLTSLENVLFKGE